MTNSEQDTVFVFGVIIGVLLMIGVGAALDSIAISDGVQLSGTIDVPVPSGDTVPAPAEFRVRWNRYGSLRVVHGVLTEEADTDD